MNFLEPHTFADIPNLVAPTWQVSPSVKGFTTTRQGGVSQGEFTSFNLGTHVGDNPEDVFCNREILSKLARLPQKPAFLNQTHSVEVAKLSSKELSTQNADAVYTNEPNQVCAVLTADCLPVLFASRDGKEVAAAHAGWRGLALGILENTVQCFKSQPSDIIAWLGPAIGPKAFEVGTDVYDAFVQKNSATRNAFVFKGQVQGVDKFFADIYQIAKIRLNALGIESIYGADYCTYTQSDLFFSYRREAKTGRMLSSVWIEEVK